MLKKSIFGLIAVVLLISMLILAACNRSSKSEATAPPATPQVTETPDTFETTTEPEATETTETPATPIVWSPDANCTVCHVMQAYVDSLKDSSLMVYAHAQTGFVCLDCHEQKVLEEVHGDADSNAASIKERKFPKQFCLGCHGSYADLMVLTKDSTALMDIADTAVNPHDSHEGEVDCFHCHRMHKKVEPKDYCYECH